MRYLNPARTGWASSGHRFQDPAVLGWRSEGALGQLSRWVHQGKLVPLRARNVSPAHRVAAAPSRPGISRISWCFRRTSAWERALSFHGLIPSWVPLVQSVTRGRPMLFETPVGDFQYPPCQARLVLRLRRDRDRSSVGADCAAGEGFARCDLFSRQDRSHGRGSTRCGCRTLDRLKPTMLTRMASGHGERMEAAAHSLARWIRRERHS